MGDIVLDLCGGSGAWSRPYREAGYEVHIITLPEFDVTKTLLGDYPDITFRPPHEYGDFLPDGTISFPYSRIAGILAAPPCTEFSVAKNTKPRDLMGAMAVVEICMQIIWEVQIHTQLDFWALENPRGLLRRFLGKPAYTFEQWQFGGDKRKATDIWGYFNVPTPTVKIKPDGMTVKNPNGISNGRDWGKRVYPPEYENYIKRFPNYTAQRAAARAITPAGFADAFYRANKLKGTIQGRMTTSISKPVAEDAALYDPQKCCSNCIGYCEYCDDSGLKHFCDNTESPCFFNDVYAKGSCDKWCGRYAEQ